MATEEDILLREVDDELKQDQTAEFFKKNGPWLLGGAAIIISGVAGLQVWRGNEARLQASSAEIYAAAITEAQATPESGATILADAAIESSGGYQALARLQQAGFEAQSGSPEAAIATLRLVIADDSVPTRLRDLARLRAAALLLDADPAAAAVLSGEVSTTQMRALADEFTAMAYLSTEDYDRAYEIFVRLMDGGEGTVSASIASRARLYAPVADAGRKGVALEPENAEAEEFIRSFTDQLNRELAAPDEAEADPAAGADEPAPENTP